MNILSGVKNLFQKISGSEAASSPSLAPVDQVLAQQNQPAYAVQLSPEALNQKRPDLLEDTGASVETSI